jgi:uncharacterized membrane protein YphA (DoxX/SURF4 family)
MAEALQIIGWIAVRVGIGYVYLFALYKNTENTAARQWLVEHTAYMFPSWSEPVRTRRAKVLAWIGMAMMLVGGLSVLIGIEGRAGAGLLFGFTAIGIYQHKREREVAMAIAEKVLPQIPDSVKNEFATIQWSAYSGHFSSELKNWGLCGICVAICCWGTGPAMITMSDKLPLLFR